MNLNKPPELVEIDEAYEKFARIIWWERQFSIAFWVIYFVALGIWILNTFDYAFPFFMLALSLALMNIPISIRLGKQRRLLNKLTAAYLRKQAIPFYKELLEKFADQPHLHIHLSENGTINITDRSKDHTLR